MLRSKQPAIAAPTVGAVQPLRMKMALQSDQADAVVEQFDNGKVDHPVILSYAAR
jgi:hypothetical protein